MSFSETNRDERLSFVCAALRQALLVMPAGCRDGKVERAYLCQAADRFLAFVDLSVVKDRNAARSLVVVALGLMGESYGGADAKVGAVLDAAGGILEEMRTPRTAVDQREALASVRLVMGAFQLGQDPKRRAVARCLTKLAEVQVDDVYRVLALPESPVIAWFEGKESLVSLPPRPRISTSGASVQQRVVPESPADLSSGLASSVNQTAMAQTVSAAVMAVVQTFAERGRPDDAVKVGDSRAQRQPFRRDRAPQFIPLKRKDPAAVEEDWVLVDAGSSRLVRRHRKAICAMMALFGALAFIFGTTIDFRAVRTESVVNGRMNTAQGKRAPEEVAKKFVYASDHSQRVALLRDSRHANIMRDHFEAMAKLGMEEEVEFIRAARSAIIQGMHQHRFHVTFTDGRSRVLALVGEPGGLVVDWPAYARLGSASWGELLEGVVQQAEMRCLVAPCQYYNYLFEDSERFQAYKITSPDCELPLYAYVRRRSHRDRILASAVGGSRRRLTLTLRSVDGSHAVQQFAISQVNALGWAEVGQDFEDSPFALPLPSSVTAK